MSSPHIIPQIIEKEALKALSYFPQLKHTHLELKFKKNIKKSTMQAQPKFSSYLFLESHVVEAERTADTFAVNNGMASYILKTKNFILNHANISTNYKTRIKKYYLSPEEIMELVNRKESMDAF